MLKFIDRINEVEFNPTTFINKAEGFHSYLSVANLDQGRYFDLDCNWRP